MLCCMMFGRLETLRIVGGMVECAICRATDSQCVIDCGIYFWFRPRICAVGAICTKSFAGVLQTIGSCPAVHSNQDMATIEPKRKPIKVLLFGTHPKQFNGYSKVVYELCKELACMPDRVSVSIFGFQNFHANGAHRVDLPESIDVYDAFANETPKHAGFGIGQVNDVVTLKRPDVIVIYNDLLVITQVLNQLKDIRAPWFKVILYIDQVYLNQKKEFIDFINVHAHAALAFTPSWRDCIIQQGLTLPCDVLEHGISTNVYFPIPQRVARKYFNLSESDFIVLNLNRNQPRKRWDTCIKAFAHVIANHHNKPGPAIKFVIGTALKGAWDILEMYQRELQKRGLTLADGIRNLIIIDNPQKLTDQEINVLYNVSDCGINTADGEGVGLCSVEPAVIGIPQIVPRLGGFVDFFDDSCAIMVEPRLAYYVDSTRDMVQGEALMCDYSDFADAIETYYADPALRAKHGTASREKIRVPHLWPSIAAHFVDVVEEVHNGYKKRALPPPPIMPDTSQDTADQHPSEKKKETEEVSPDDIIIADDDDDVVDTSPSNATASPKQVAVMGAAPRSDEISNVVLPGPYLATRRPRRWRQHRRDTQVGAHGAQCPPSQSVVSTPTQPQSSSAPKHSDELIGSAAELLALRSRIDAVLQQLSASLST